MVRKDILNDGSMWFYWEDKKELTTKIVIYSYLFELGFEWIKTDEARYVVDNNDTIKITGKRDELIFSLKNDLIITYTSNHYQYSFDYIMKVEKGEKTKIIKPDLNEDNNKGSTSVLLSDVIEYYIKHYFLVVPCYPKNIRAASYDFTIGDEYKDNDKPKFLTDHNPELVVKPHDAVVVRTKEHLNMPRFLIGRWNLRVSRVYDGLVWVGGIHVDPGWEGELWCPLYNLSKKDAAIPKNETFASVDFVKTTEFHEGCIEYQSNRADPNHPGSSLEEMRSELTVTKSELKEYKNTHYTLIGIIIAAISILTAFTVPSDVSQSIANSNQTSTGYLASVLNLDILSSGIISVILSTIAIILSVVALLKSKKSIKDLERS